MRSLLIQNGIWVAGRALTAAVLALIGLLAGAGCALYPQALPWGILGLAGLLLLWVMPDLKTVPARLAGTMLIPFMISVLSVPAYYAIILPGIPWISVRRVIYVVFALSVAITLSGASTKRAELMARLKAAPFISGLVIAYFAICMLATATSAKVGVSISDTLNNILFGLIPFLATTLLVTSERKVRMMFIACVICVAVDMVLGAIEYHLHRPFLVYALPAEMRNQMVAQAAGYAGLMGGGVMRGGMARAASIFLVPLSWGEMAAMLSPIAAFFAAFGRTLYVRAFGIFGVAACFVSVFLTGSRGGYVGFIAGAILFWLIFVLYLVRTKPQSLIGPTALCICAIMSVATMGSVFFVGRIHTAVLGGAESQSSDDGRSQQWAMAKPRILARPVLGYGPGMSAEIVGWTNAAGDPSLDSYAVTLLVGIGIPGCMVFFGMLIFAALRCFWRFLLARSAIDRYGLSLGCTLIAYTLYRTTLSQTENNTLLFILLGLVVSLATLAKHSEETGACIPDL